MNHFAPRHAVALLSMLLASTGALAAPPASSPGLRQATDRVVIDTAPAMRCLRRFDSRGTFRLDTNVSGAGTSTEFIPDGKFVQLRRVEITLQAPGLRAAQLSMVSSGLSTWHDLRMQDGAAVYSASRDGELYADGGTRIKFVAYRHRPSDHPVTGDYVIHGCIVDALPTRMRRPDERVPRLPKQRPAPLEPVETPRPLPRPAQGDR